MGKILSSIQIVSAIVLCSIALVQVNNLNTREAYIRGIKVGAIINKTNDLTPLEQEYIFQVLADTEQLGKDVNVLEVMRMVEMEEEQLELAVENWNYTFCK